MDKIILDTDIGDDIDDAYALSLLMAEGAPISGVTTVYRNAEQRAKIAAKMIELWGKNIPVYAGESYPEKQPLFRFEKADEGDRPNIPHYIPSVMQDERIGTNGVDALLRMIEEASGEITLISIGPMTNLARALKKSPETFGKIKQILLMGGDYTGKLAEWNVLCDPEAAAAVFKSSVNIRAVGVDITCKCTLDGEMLSFLSSLHSKKNKLLAKMTDIWIEHNQKTGGIPIMHDPLTVSVLFNESMVRFARGRFRVVLEGADRGKTLPDENGKEIEYAVSADYPAFMQKLREDLANSERDS